MSTSYNSVPGDPAFLANKKATGKSSSLQHSLADCLYSFSNLIIIVSILIHPSIHPFIDRSIDRSFVRSLRS